MASRICGPCVVLRPAMAFSTVAKSPLAVGEVWSSTRPTAFWLKVWPPKEKAVQYQCQEHVVGVVGERRRQEGEVAGDARVGAGDATRRIEDRVGRAAAIVAGLRQHLHGAALDRSRAADIDAVGLARRIGLDLVGRARHLDVGAV